MSRSAPPRRSRRRPRFWPANAAMCTIRAALCLAPRSRDHTFFADGARELFDCAGRGRIDVSFCPAARSTAKAISTWSASATTGRPKVRFPACSVRLSLLRRAQGDPVSPRAFAPHSRAEGRFHQRAGHSPDNVFRPGGPIALVPTAACSTSTANAAAFGSRAFIRATALTK